MTPGTPCPFTIDADGMRLAVRLTPKADRTAFGRVVVGADGRAVLGLRVAAPPVEGAANAALVAFLAKSLGLRKADVTILSGATSRLKLLHLAGDGAGLAARLTALLDP